MQRQEHYYVIANGRTISDYKSKREAVRHAAAIPDGELGIEVRMVPTVLDLVLKVEWYDMIAAGIKKEEYRELKPFYKQRLERIAFHSGGATPHGHPIMDVSVCRQDYDVVRFHRAYTNTTMELECKGIRIGRGKPEWGAPTDKDVYIISLGDFVKAADMATEPKMEAVRQVVNG